MNLTQDSVLEMHPLQSRPENDEEILIGRPDISNFIVLPNIGVEIIELLNSGKTIREVADIMEQKLGEPVDVLDFANDLIHEYQFVHKVDGQVVNPPVKMRGHLPWIRQEWAQLLLNRYTMAIGWLIFLTGVFLCSFNPRLFPSYTDFFISSSITVSLVIATLIFWVHVFLHELFHLIASISLGIPCRIGISHRLVFLVAETDMSNLVLLPHNKRYKPLLAGITFDATMFGIGLILLWLNSLGIIQLPDIAKHIIPSYILMILFSFLFQSMFFMETDIYYVFTTIFRCQNLLANTRLYVRKLLRLATQEQLEQYEGIDEREKQIIQRWYVWFYLIGVIVAIGLFVFYLLPITLTFIHEAVQRITKSQIFSLQFLDGLSILLIALLPLCLLVFSWIRSLRQKNNSHAV